MLKKNNRLQERETAHGGVGTRDRPDLLAGAAGPRPETGAARRAGPTVETPGRHGFLETKPERSVSRTLGKEAGRAWESRHSSLFFPLSRYGPAESSTTAGNADRAVLYDFMRFPAGIQTASDPPSRRMASPATHSCSIHTAFVAGTRPAVESVMMPPSPRVVPPLPRPPTRGRPRERPHRPVTGRALRRHGRPTPSIRSRAPRRCA